MTPGLRASGLTKRFRAVTVLDGVDLEVAPGQFVAVTGANGAGKTTLVRILATLLGPDGGAAEVNGLDVIAEPEAVRRQIGVALVSDRGMYWRLSGEHNLRFFARALGMSRREAAEAAREAAASVGIAEILGRPVAGYSTGQRQRLNLARGLLGRPPVVLVDEPMRGLDDQGIERVRTILRERADAGAAVLAAGPTVAEFDGICDAVHVLRAGVLAA